MHTNASSELRKRVKKSIDEADDTTVKMVMAMLEVREQENLVLSHYEQDIEQRFADIEQGKVKTIGLDEFEKVVRKGKY